MSKPTPVKAKRRRDTVVYRTPANIYREDKRFAMIAGSDGKSHRYLNCAIPRDTTPDGRAELESAICAKKNRCGHAYSHMLGSGKAVCWECAVDDAEALVAELEQETGESLGYISPARIVDHARKGVRVMWQPTRLAGRKERGEESDF